MYKNEREVNPMTKIRKSTARIRFVECKPFIMVPRKLRPEYGIKLSAAACRAAFSFDRLCNEFEWYNCNRETGERIAFYIDDGDE